MATSTSKHISGGGGLSLMTLADLIRSSATIHSLRGKYGYAMAQAIQKQFGTIYYNNKVVVYNEQSHILEIRMGIGTKTEKAYKGLHSVRMAIYGVEGDIYNSLEELYADKTGKIADSEDINTMTKAIQGKGGPPLDREVSEKERERNKDKEANKFTLSYGVEPNAQLSGYIVPVASIDPDTGAYTYNDSGKVFYMENGIDVNSFVRVSCSCFSGDTEIILGDGSYAKLQDLVGKENFSVLAYNQATERYEVANAVSCELKKKDAKMIKITLDDGNEIKVTPEHRFLLRSGQWVQAKDLKPSDSLRAFYGVNQNGLYRKNGTTLTKVREYLEEKRFYTYIYLDPTKAGEYNYGEISFDHEPIYVGKGCDRRYKEHLYLTKETNLPLKERIYSILDNGVEPIIIKNSVGLSETDALLEEEYLINLIGISSNGGPLLNVKTLIGSSLSDIGRAIISNRMKLNNPMKNPEVVKKQQETSIKNGAYDITSRRMKENNPMYNRDTVEQVTQKYYERVGDMDEHMRNLRKRRTHEGLIAGAKKRKENDPNTYSSMIEGHKEYLKNAISNGTYHTQSEEFKEKVRISSKKNWENSEYRKSVIEKGKATKNKRKLEDPKWAEEQYNRKKESLMKGTAMIVQKRKDNPEWSREVALKTVKTRTINLMATHIKENGGFNENTYKNRPGCYSIGTLRKHGKLDEYIELATKKAYENHKVLKVESIDSEDVYCITVEGLPNFTVATRNINPDIISGVTVHNCSNYYFVHGLYNYWAGAHLGQAPAPYPGKSESSTTIMNVEKSPGMCKHLMMFTMLLLNGGILSKVGTKGFEFNLQDIRNRTNKLQIPRKLADEGDWGKHAQNLQRTLRNADKRHVAQYGNSDLSSKFKEYEKQEMNRNSITFDKWMNGTRKAARDRYYSNTPLSDFSRDAQKIQNYYGQNLNSINRATKVKSILDLFRHYE